MMMMHRTTTTAMNTGTAAAAETSGTTRAATATRMSRRYRRRTSDEIKPPQSRSRRQTALTVAMPPLLLLYTSLTVLLALLPTVEASRYAKICPLTDSKLVRVAVDPSVEGGFVLLDDEEEDNNWGSSSSSGDAESGGGRGRGRERSLSLLRGSGGAGRSATTEGAFLALPPSSALSPSSTAADAKAEFTENYDDEEPFLFQTMERRDEDTTWDPEGKTILHARECPCAPRRTYCLQPSPATSSSDAQSHFDDTIPPADTCGVQLNDSGSTTSCFTVSSRTVFVRNAWPVVVLWYGALVVFLFATDNGRNARHYVMIKVCSPSFAKLGTLLGLGDGGGSDDGEGGSEGRGRRSNANERRVDQIVQHEIEIRDRMRRAAALGHRRRMYLGVRQRGRRNVMMEEEEDDWDEEGEFTGTLVLKTKRYDQKKEMERRRRKLLGRQESGSLGKDVAKDTEGGGEGDEDEASRGNANHPSSDGGGSSDDAAGASRTTTTPAASRRRPSDGTPDTVPTIESPFSLSSEDDFAFVTPASSTLRSEGSFVNEEEDSAADPTTATVDGCHVKDRCDNGEHHNDDHDDDDDEDHEITCTICIGPVQDGDRVGALPCEHVFHVDCLKEWIKRKNVCPLCQEPRIASPKMRPSPTSPGEREGGGEEQQERGNGTAAAASASSTTTSGGSPDARRRREPFPLRTMRMRLFRMDGDNNDGNDNGGDPATGAAGERSPAGASSGRGGNDAAATGDDAATNDDDARRTSPQGGVTNALRPSPSRPPLPPSSSASPRTVVLVGRPENAAHHHHRRSRSSSSQSVTLTRLSPSSSYGSDAV